MERKDFFESLFDRKTFFQRRMLLLLNSTNGRWVSSEWLGDQLGLSKRTTLNTINDLANQVAVFRPDQFTFELSKSRGVSLNVENDADIYELITFIVKQCATVGMLESLLTEEFESVKSYAMRHFISESTVRRDLNKIQELLANYSIEIGRERAKLLGEEHQIRMFMGIFYWSVYRGSSWPFKYVDERLMETFVEDLLNNEATVYPKIPLGHKKQMAYLFAEATIRTRKGNFVQMTPAFAKPLKQSFLYPCFERRIGELHGIVNDKHSEIPFFFAAWLVLPETMDILKKEILDRSLAKLADEKGPIYLATDLMMTRFQEVFRPIEEEEQVRFRAYVTGSHYFAYYFKGFNTDVTGNTYRHTFFKRYPKLVAKTRRFITDLYRESRNPIFLEVDYLLISYLRNIFFLDEPCQYEVPIHVMIESDMSGLLMEKFIQQINGYFSYLYNLKFHDVFDCHELPVDVLLTTGNMAELCRVYPEAETVVVSKALSIVDMSRINDVLEGVSVKKYRSDC